MNRKAVKQPKHLRKIDGRTHVTASFLCGRFSIRPDLLDQALTRSLGELETSLIEAGGEVWIDSGLFYDLSISPELSPYFPEERQQTVLHLLGHFEQRPAGAVVTRGRSCA